MSGYRVNWLGEKKAPRKPPTKRDELWFAPWYITAAHLFVYAFLLVLAAAALSGACWVLVWGFHNFPLITGFTALGVAVCIAFSAVIDYDNGDLQGLKFAAKEKAEKDFERRKKAYEASLRGE